MAKLNGFLDHMRENLEVLDEQIAIARKRSKLKGNADKAVALQWAKTLRDLVELRNTTLANVKVHVLGRDETGAPTEPADYYNGNSEVEFEHVFQTFLTPWTPQDLKLKCEDCNVNSEDVSTRKFYHAYADDEYFDLCKKCYEKRQAADRVLECERCHVKSEDVKKRVPPGEWIGNTLFEGQSYNLCEKCYNKRTTESSEESQDATPLLNLLRRPT